MLADRSLDMPACLPLRKLAILIDGVFDGPLLGSKQLGDLLDLEVFDLIHRWVAPPGP